MNVSADLLRAFQMLGERTLLPRVRALHLPKKPGCSGKMSAFCAIELEGGVIGLAYVGLDDTHARLEGIDVSAADPLRLIKASVAAHGTERSIGMATANALTRWLFERTAYEPPRSRDSIGGIRVDAGVRVGMVGFFKPLLSRVLETGSDLTVLELPPEEPGTRDGWRITLNPADLADCSQILCTSTVLLNDTLDRVRAACRAAEDFVLIGPGAGCLPDPLFARGVTRLGGSWILDSAGVIDALGSGQSWSGYARKFQLDRNDYPGLQTLLNRL